MSFSVQSCVLFFLLLISTCAVFGCHKSDGTGGSGDSDTETETESETDSETEIDTNTEPDLFEWIPISGGSFMMGKDDMDGFGNQMPEHEVTVPDFEMLKTEVTVKQYRSCFNDGVCDEPMPDGYEPPDDFMTSITWDLQDNDDLPVNAINWFQAVRLCEWAGGRLPSEAEWEYAASNEGQDVSYPWGEDEPNCDLVIMNDEENGMNCGLEDAMWPVCSRPDGNTEQGLCDMSGNVAEWVQDGYHGDYNEAPTDGSAWEDEGDEYSRVVRGGHADTTEATNYQLTISYRSPAADYTWNALKGFRCVR